MYKLCFFTSPNINLRYPCGLLVYLKILVYIYIYDQRILLWDRALRPKNLIHHLIECSKGICLAKRHNKELVESIHCKKCHIMDILWKIPYLITTFNFYLAKKTSPLYFVKCLLFLGPKNVFLLHACLKNKVHTHLV